MYGDFAHLERVLQLKIYLGGSKPGSGHIGHGRVVLQEL